MTSPHVARGSRSAWFNGDLPFEHNLPSGCCNYRDLSIGSRAPLCGCQRFYLNASQNAANDTAERAWCFCGHHACFHSAFSHQQSRVQELAAAASQQDGGLIENGMPAAVTLQRPASAGQVPTGLGIQPGSQSQSIDTRIWQALNNFARQQDDSASITTSKLPSTVAPSVVNDDRLSPNRTNLSHSCAHRSMGPPVHIPSTIIPKHTEEYSATEVATPSVAGTPDFCALAESSSRAKASPSNPQAISTKVSHVPSSSHAAETANQAHSLQEIHDLMCTYSHRLEALESLSFSQIPCEEIQDRFDLLEGRINDLEGWRTEQDRAASIQENDEVADESHEQLPPHGGGSFASDASYDRNAAIHVEAAVLATLAANAETHPRFDILEDRVADLEHKALPSFANPWQIEVVLLPWSRQLKGIWFSSHEAIQHSLRSATQASVDWTSTQSAASLSFQSTGAWTTQSIEAWAREAQEWLSPKACGPGGIAFQRLRSRGLVQTIVLTAADAHHVLRVIGDAFGELLPPRQALPSEHQAKYQGLCESFIPLRKVRKSSRLRFLDPPEMITSGLWTAGFLDSSVCMKAGSGQRRLYITTSDAYIQPADDHILKWEDIRTLPSFSSTSNNEQFAQQSTTEEWWAYRENLDEPMSAQSSFGASEWSTQSRMSDVHAQEPPQTVTTPPIQRGLSQQRTMSLPTSMSALLRSEDRISPRHVSSFGTATKHQQEDDGRLDGVEKRRRTSPSPELERRGVNFTPRWSREPPSPFTSETALEIKSQGTGSRKRGTTPFAYATPHSNSNYVERMDSMAGDGDTEVNTDVLGALTDAGEEEWEGVDDEYADENMVDGALDDVSPGDANLE